MTDRMRMETPDLTEKNIEKIAELFPNCITESKDEKGNLKKAINFDILKQMLSKEIVDGDEAYEFTWVGKKAAMLEANKPIRKTLRPCPEESLNWDTTQNLYIEGDNLEVLKLLQESYLGKVKMIYIDPPYNTGSDSFTYRDDYSMNQEDYEKFSGQVDEEGNRIFKENSETNPRFHSVWCSTLYSCLMVARNLLSDDGVIFISIDDNEQENLKKICDELFGASCFVDSIIWNKRVPKNDNKGIGNIHEYILVYIKSNQIARQFTMTKDGLDDIFELLETFKKKRTPIPEAEQQLKQLYNKKGY
ncbi:MAG: site-specific DNA-methyltransferase, partial [Candidatus Riflebacteria bacterium]|nr:site-specific DNA-methyltransferase [Candidatus Riflebacteria bacterium]